MKFFVGFTSFLKYTKACLEVYANYQMHANMHFSFVSAARSSSKPTDSDSKWQLMYVILPAMTLITAVAVAAAVMMIAMIGELDMSILV